MIDEIYDRGYQAGRAELHEGIDRLARNLRDALAPALAAIHQFEWGAPWQARARSKH